MTLASGKVLSIKVKMEGAWCPAGDIDRWMVDDEVLTDGTCKNRKRWLKRVARRTRSILMTESAVLAVDQSPSVNASALPMMSWLEARSNCR